MFVAMRQLVPGITRNIVLRKKSTRMKILLVILQGLVWKVLSHDEAKCRKEAERKHYYIYTANVSLKVQVCVYDFNRNTGCNQFHKWDTPYNFKEALQLCETRARRVYPVSTVYTTVCKTTANASLFENSLKIKSLRNHLQFNLGYYNAGGYLLLWNPYITQNLGHIYNASFDIWTDAQTQSKFISDGNSSVILTSKIKAWPFVAWKTNFNGIVASTANINSFGSTNSLTRKFNSSSLQICGIAIKTQVHSTATLLKNLYIYTCPTTVFINFCLANPSDSCERLGFDESVDDVTYLSQCIYNFFNTSTGSCTYQNSNITVCRKAQKVDLKKNAVENISSDCKYSDGICHPIKAFWKYNNDCNFQVVNKYDKSKNPRGIKFKGNDLILTEEGIINGAKVWYTNNQSVLVSETKLHFHSDYDLRVMKNLQFCFQYLNKIVSEQDKGIMIFYDIMWYFIFAAILWVLWYIFSITVNFCSLWKHGKYRPSKSYAYLINCVSQSLTNRYLYFHEKSTENNEMIKLPSQHFIDNELYNKPH